MENALNIEVLETISVTTATMRKATSGDLEVTAKVTERNGKVTLIDDIKVRELPADSEQTEGDAEAPTIWQGYANTNISGSFHSPGREVEVIKLVTAFVNQLRTPAEDN